SPYLVVGIDNTDLRNADYTVDVDSSYGGGNGDTYLSFIVDIAKPVIESTFRTRCGPRNTALAGSSLGGLITIDALTQYPEVFGRYGCLSSSIWWNSRSVLTRVENFLESDPGLGPDGPDVRIWIDGGALENGVSPRESTLATVLRNNRSLLELLTDAGMEIGTQVGYYEDLEGGHNESSWANRLPEVLTFLLSDTDYELEDAQAINATVLGGYLYADASPMTSHLIATAQFADGARITWPVAYWDVSSQDSGVLTISTETGEVHAEGGGTGRIDLVAGEAEATLEIPIAAQTVVTDFWVTVPGGSSPSTVRIAGSAPALGSWDPRGFTLSYQGGNVWAASVRLELGSTLEFKVTRGSWATVERTAQGADISNRTAEINGDDVVVTVAGW
ncbi:MAG: hypothetical protein KC561_07865, partial [Myxococcales bacterium]|nr:hypothetical protein [Myxococcales bacterium]